ncbi:MAG: murein transglycosylase A [Alphaproteobacteria bacterium]
MAVRRGTIFTGMLAAVVLAGGSAVPSPAEPFRFPDAQLEPATWSDLNGWAGDDHIAAFTAFLTSCQPFLKDARPRDPRPVGQALWEICRRTASLKPATAAEARAFFEENFRPVRITKLGDAEGFLTGYYEPIVQGSRFPNQEFSVPLYRRPRDLEAQGYKPGSPSFPNSKSVPIGRRNDKGELVPYPDRGQIEAGALDGRHLEICWVRDWFEALTIQIQGSARVMLEDGLMVRINYDSFNGHPYSSIGRVLIERNEIPREEMSMQRIKDWMKVNPNKAAEVRATNRSFVFFRITGLDKNDEPVGAQNVPLMPGRSIAVDKTHVYGTPIYIEATLPIDSPRPVTPFRRLMIAQDTGSAIVGPARADLYWGAGDGSARIAGRIRHPGRFVMLLPRELDMIEAGRAMPLPLVKPASLVEDAKREAAAEAKKDAAEAKKKAAGAAAEPNKTDNGAKKPARPSRGQAVPARPRSGT